MSVPVVENLLALGSREVVLGSDDRFGRKPGREVICKLFRPLYAYVTSSLLPL